MSLAISNRPAPIDQSVQEPAISERLDFSDNSFPSLGRALEAEIPQAAKAVVMIDGVPYTPVQGGSHPHLEKIEIADPSSIVRDASGNVIANVILRYSDEVRDHRDDRGYVSFHGLNLAIAA